jgi:hypothetical protein
MLWPMVVSPDTRSASSTPARGPALEEPLRALVRVVEGARMLMMVSPTTEKRKWPGSDHARVHRP